MSATAEETEMQDEVVETGDDDGDVTEPDPEAAPEEEPEEEPEAAAAPQSQREIEKAMEKLDKEAARHTSRVSEIMGEDALLLKPCELCEPNMQGFRFPEVAPGDPRELLYAVLEAGDEGSYADASDAEPCPDCKARGQVKTGSLVPDHALKLCNRCSGSGWIPKGSYVPAAAAPENGNGHEAKTPAELGFSTATDFMNRPAGHPNFGKLPAYLSADEAALDVRDGYAAA